MYGDEKPKLVFETSLMRSHHRKRFFRLLFLIVIVAGGYWALDISTSRGLVEPIWLDVGRLAAVVLGGLLAVRGLYHLVRWFTRRTEILRIYDKGIFYQRGTEQHKFSWSHLSMYREGGRGVYLFGKLPLLQWGAHTLNFGNRLVFNYNSRFGDMRPFAKAVRKLAAEATGSRISKQLRYERPVKLAPGLVIYPDGLTSDKIEIPWDELDVRLKNGKLVVRKKNRDNRFVVIKSYPQHRVNNVGGLLDVATESIRLYQPERFSH
jgi:hypothetical protein